VSCAEGDRGFVYEGVVEWEAQTLDFAELRATRTEIMLNLANPAAAVRWWGIPVARTGCGSGTLGTWSVGSALLAWPPSEIKKRCCRYLLLSGQLRWAAEDKHWRSDIHRAILSPL